MYRTHIHMTRWETDDASTWHLYVYCANNPINYIDPSGHKRYSIDSIEQIYSSYGRKVISAKATVIWEVINKKIYYCEMKISGRYYEKNRHAWRIAKCQYIKRQISKNKKSATIKVKLVLTYLVSNKLDSIKFDAKCYTDGSVLWDKYLKMRNV